MYKMMSLPTARRIRHFWTAHFFCYSRALFASVVCFRYGFFVTEHNHHAVAD